jgi:hypothetical protein
MTLSLEQQLFDLTPDEKYEALSLGFSGIKREIACHSFFLANAIPSDELFLNEVIRQRKLETYLAWLQELNNTVTAI